MVLIQSKARLGAGDSGFFERLLRESRTWALVDMLSRAQRASGVTMREVVKYLSPQQRDALLAAR